eukprot:scaffold6456_cov147-Amphora_coffeaeformis.AAC.2
MTIEVADAIGRIPITLPTQIRLDGRVGSPMGLGSHDAFVARYTRCVALRRISRKGYCALEHLSRENNGRKGNGELGEHFERLVHLVFVYRMLGVKNSRKETTTTQKKKIEIETRNKSFFGGFFSRDDVQFPKYEAPKQKKKRVALTSFYSLSFWCSCHCKPCCTYAWEIQRSRVSPMSEPARTDRSCT